MGKGNEKVKQEKEVRKGNKLKTIRQYVPSSPVLCPISIKVRQNLSPGDNVVCDGSKSWVFMESEEIATL